MRPVGVRRLGRCAVPGNEFVVGYGLDYNEEYRNLRDIATLAPTSIREALEGRSVGRSATSIRSGWGDLRGLRA